MILWLLHKRDEQKNKRKPCLKQEIYLWIMQSLQYEMTMMIVKSDKKGSEKHWQKGRLLNRIKTVFFFSFFFFCFSLSFFKLILNAPISKRHSPMLLRYFFFIHFILYIIANVMISLCAFVYNIIEKGWWGCTHKFVFQRRNGHFIFNWKNYRTYPSGVVFGHYVFFSPFKSLFSWAFLISKEIGNKAKMRIGRPKNH